MADTLFVTGAVYLAKLPNDAKLGSLIKLFAVVDDVVAAVVGAVVVTCPNTL
jgi:hypothetical protein